MMYAASVNYEQLMDRCSMCVCVCLTQIIVCILKFQTKTFTANVQNNLLTSNSYWSQDMNADIRMAEKIMCILDNRPKTKLQKVLTSSTCGSCEAGVATGNLG